MSTAQKASYLCESTAKWMMRRGLQCPSCGSAQTAIVDRKYLVTQLRRCKSCELMFRTPTGDARSMAAFYQASYTQGFTTDLPDEGTLAQLLATEFKGTEKDFGTYVQVLRALGVKPGMRLLDFGCSWGYGSWQLSRAGFVVSAFEIGEARCQFAREQLGIDAHSRIDAICGQFDVVFTAHVLEHVPAVGNILKTLWDLVKLGGKLVAFTPNGSVQFREHRREAWHGLWGLVHPNMLDERFYLKALGDQVLLASNPYPLTDLAAWSGGTRRKELALTGDELLCASVRLR